MSHSSLEDRSFEVTDHHWRLKSQKWSPKNRVRICYFAKSKSILPRDLCFYVLGLCLDAFGSESICVLCPISDSLWCILQKVFVKYLPSAGNQEQSAGGLCIQEPLWKDLRTWRWIVWTKTVKSTEIVSPTFWNEIDLNSQKKISMYVPDCV